MAKYRKVKNMEVITATMAINFQPKVVDSKSSDEEFFFIKKPK